MTRPPGPFDRWPGSRPPGRSLCRRGRRSRVGSRPDRGNAVNPDLMCRLFGFLSSVPERVHASLVSEKNSLLAQSREHKDGWGIASYDGSLVPAVAHGLGAAHSDPEFERVSSLVSSHAVLAHVRLASVGGIHLNNAHPFVYERWAFAHN